MAANILSAPVGDSNTNYSCSRSTHKCHLGFLIEPTHAMDSLLDHIMSWPIVTGTHFTVFFFMWHKDGPSINMSWPAQNRTIDGANLLASLQKRVLHTRQLHFLPPHKWCIRFGIVLNEYVVIQTDTLGVLDWHVKQRVTLCVITSWNWRCDSSPSWRVQHVGFLFMIITNLVVTRFPVGRVYNCEMQRRAVSPFIVTFVSVSIHAAGMT